MGRLDGRVAIVTGAGEGIGHGVARLFAREGAALVVAELDEDLGRVAAEALASEFAVPTLFTHTDVGEQSQVRAMVAGTIERFGRVDVLVNNAWGGGSLRRVEHKTDADMTHGFAVGFYGPFWAMQEAFPTMRANGYGRIVNLCSLNGVNAHVGTADYNVAKEALRALTRTAAREWAPHGITANVICPAAKSASFDRVAAMMPGMLELAAQMNPMGRMGDPEADIAPVALFLASEESRYLTGNTLFVDGGAHINGSPWAPELPNS